MLSAFFSNMKILRQKWLLGLLLSVVYLVSWQPIFAAECFTLFSEKNARPSFSATLKNGQEFQLETFEIREWESWLDVVLEKGLNDIGFLDGRNPIWETLPRNIQELVLARASSNLRGLNSSRKFSNFPAKRVASTLLSVLLRPDLLFKKMVDNPQDPSQVFKAYEEYFKQNEKIFRHSPEIGGYGVKEVLAAAKIAQEELIKVLQEDGENSLGFFGSFPMGRADLKESDLDFSRPHDNASVTLAFPKILRRLAAKLRQMGHEEAELPNNDRIVDGIKFGPDTIHVNLVFLGVTSPIMLIVTPHEITLRVWSMDFEYSREWRTQHSSGYTDYSLSEKNY